MAKRPRKGRSRGARSARGAACVLVSGGLDSAVLVRDALRSFRSVQPLYVRAGLRWEPTEVRALRSYLRSLRSARLRPLAFVDVPMTDLYGDHWSTSGRHPPGYHAGDASVYLPGRNIALFSKAATFCALRRIPVLISGILSANPFPDGSVAFLRAMERALRAGLGAPLAIRTPYRSLKKHQVIRRGRGLRLERTFSCINPGRGGRHCGDCCKCAERVEAFRRAGIRDPTFYAGGPGALEAPRSVRPGSALKPGSRRRRTTRAAP